MTTQDEQEIIYKIINDNNEFIHMGGISDLVLTEAYTHNDIKILKQSVKDGKLKLISGKLLKMVDITERSNLASAQQ